jgi:hypothetical protein
LEAISADGRFVLWDTSMGPRTRRHPGGVFLRDRLRHTTVKLASNVRHMETIGLDVSNHGRFVLLEHDRLLNGGVDRFGKDIVLLDRARNTSTPMILAQTSRAVFTAAMSGDAHIVFVEALERNRPDSLVLIDRAADTRTLLPADRLRFDAPGGFDLSRNGRFVVFMSRANDLVAGDTNGKEDAFRLELRTRAVVRVDLDAGGGELDAGAFDSVISQHGGFVAFTTSSAAVPDDTNRVDDAYLRGRVP